MIFKISYITTINDGSLGFYLDEDRSSMRKWVLLATVKTLSSNALKLLIESIGLILKAPLLIVPNR